MNVFRIPVKIVELAWMESMNIFVPVLLTSLDLIVKVIIFPISAEYIALEKTHHSMKLFLQK